MPQRFYLSRGVAAAVVPANPAAWDQLGIEGSTGRQTSQLSAVKQNTSLSTEDALNFLETTATAPWQVLHQTWVTDQTFGGDESWAGMTADFVLAITSTNVGADASLQCVIFTCDGTTGGIKQILYGGHSTVHSATVGALGQNLREDGTRESRIMASLPIVDHSPDAGDRLVVQYGVRYMNTLTGNMAARAGRGDPTAGTDFPLTAGDGDTTKVPWVEFSEDPFTAASGGGTQTARPTADASVGAWITDTGASTDLYTAIDEVTPSDVDYVRSPTDPANAPYVATLGTLTDPAVSTGHIVRYRYRKSGTATIDLTVELRQGYVSEGTPGTLIKQWVHSGIATTATTAEQTLSAGEADAITDYADLALRFVANMPA